MIQKASAKWPVPKLRGMLEVMPLSLDQYQRMIEANILHADDSVELLEGFIVGMDKGMGQDRPSRSQMPNDPPRLAGMLELWPLTLDQYERMNALGILGEDDPIEFLEGYLIKLDRGEGPGMAPEPLHSVSTTRANRLFNRAIPEIFVVRCQDPIRLGAADVAGAGSSPQPDISIAIGPDTRYLLHHPGPLDLILLLEVADSSLLSDRRYKVELYARAGIARYWIVNIPERQLEVFTDPDSAAGEYRSKYAVKEDGQVTLAAADLPAVSFAVKDFLPWNARAFSRD